MSAKDSIQQFKDFLRNNPRYLFIGFMVALLLLRVYLYVFESKLNDPIAPTPGKADLTEKVNRESDVYNKVKQMIVLLPEFQESFVADLAADNMFDPRMVSDSQQREKRAQELLNQALTARSQGRIADAVSLARQVLELQDRNLVAIKIVDELSPQLAPEPTPAETPADTTPTAAPEGQ